MEKKHFLKEILKDQKIKTGMALLAAGIIFVCGMILASYVLQPEISLNQVPEKAWMMLKIFR